MASAFLQGFTGGMGAMTNMLNSQQQRQYQQQQMSYQQQQQENQAFIQNGLALAHIHNSFEDDEQRQAFDSGILDALNQREDIQGIIRENEEPGTTKSLSGFEVTSAGIVPMITVTSEDGKKYTRPLTQNRENNGKDSPMAINQDDFFQMIGSVPNLVDDATRLQAQILGKGGSLPEQRETFSQTQRDGSWVNRSNLTGKETSMGIGGGSRSGSGSSSGSMASEKPIESWKAEGEGGSETNYAVYKYGDNYVMTETTPDGKVKRRDYTNEWNQWQQGGGGSSVAARMGVGGVDAATDTEKVTPQNAPIHRVGPDGQLIDQEAQPKKEKPPAEKPPAEKPPAEKPPKSSSGESSTFNVSEEQRQRIRETALQYGERQREAEKERAERLEKRKKLEEMAAERRRQAQNYRGGVH